MRDTRITLFDSQPVTVSSNTTVNGTTLDLLENRVGDYKEGAEAGYGIGVEILVVPTSATGTDITLALKWQVSTDGSSWTDDQEIYPATNVIDETVDATPVGTKLAIPTRLRTPNRYARVVATTTSTSSGSFTIQGWASDGTTKHGKATQVRI